MGKPSFLTFVKFSKQVKYRPYNLYLCICGKIVEKREARVKNGEIQTCGDKIFHTQKGLFLTTNFDINQKIGNLTIKNLLGSKQNTQGKYNVWWLCTCVCGNLVEKTTRALNKAIKNKAMTGCIPCSRAISNDNNYKYPFPYNGALYRSSWEFAIKVLLETLQVEAIYEPESIWIENLRVYYTPDFYLPQYNLYIEIKGPTIPGIEKFNAFEPNARKLLIDHNIFFKLLPIPEKDWMMICVRKTLTKVKVREIVNLIKAKLAKEHRELFLHLINHE